MSAGHPPIKRTTKPFSASFVTPALHSFFCWPGPSQPTLCSSTPYLVIVYVYMLVGKLLKQVV